MQSIFKEASVSSFDSRYLKLWGDWIKKVRVIESSTYQKNKKMLLMVLNWKEERKFLKKPLYSFGKLLTIFEIFGNFGIFVV